MHEDQSVSVQLLHDEPLTPAQSGQNFALKIWGERFKNIPYFIEGTQEFLGFRMANQRILIFVVTAVVMLGFWIFIKKAKFGFGLRATAQDRDMAMLVGVDVNKVISFTFIVGSGTAALGGVLIASHVGQINYYIGFIAGIKAFVAAVLGVAAIAGGWLWLQSEIAKPGPSLEEAVFEVDYGGITMLNLQASGRDEFADIGPLNPVGFTNFGQRVQVFG